MTKSKKKAIIFCESYDRVLDMVVSVRVIENGKRCTFNCNPFQALRHIKYCDEFIWFDNVTHI